MVALDIALRSKRFIKRQLGQIPGRSWFESTIKVEGERVKRLSIPTMSSLYYQLQEDRLLFATKKGSLRLVLNKKGESRWITRKDKVELTVLDLYMNAALIYGELGVYDGERLGTACDDL